MSNQINLLSEQTQRLLRAELDAIEYTSIAELREKSLEALNRYMNAGTGIASAYGATFFQDVMAENGETTTAKTITVTTDEANEQAVRGMINSVAQGGSVSTFFDALQNRLDTNIRKVSNECVLENVKDRKKHLKFARVPVGRETCAWCFMLASYGFHYWSKSSAGQNAHWHSHCDCRIVPGYDDVDPDEQVEGYKPSELQDRFRDCYNAVKMPNGSFDVELFERDVQAGKYNRDDWERWKTNRIMAEIRSRDNNWLWNGTTSTYRKEEGAKPYKKEEKVSKLLTHHGLNVVAIKEINKTGIKTPDSYIQGVEFEYRIPEGWSKKNDRNEEGEKTVRNAFYHAQEKKCKKLIISNTENNVNYKELVNLTRKVFLKGDFEVDEVLIVGKDGTINRLKK